MGDFPLRLENDGVGIVVHLLGLQMRVVVARLGQEDPLEKEMATLFSILAWRIPWTEEPGWLLSMGSQSQK